MSENKSICGEYDYTGILALLVDLYKNRSDALRIIRDADDGRDTWFTDPKNLDEVFALTFKMGVTRREYTVRKI